MFETFIGQERWKNFFSRRAGRRLAHAYAFVGPAHLGKKTFMRMLAHELICRGDSESCGTCPPCLAWRGDVHPDLMVLEPNEKGVIGVEEVRDFVSELHRSSSGSSHRVALLDGAEHCTSAAGNALLKVLEEPPKNVIILVRVQDIEQLPATLVSRLQICRFNPVPLAALAHALEERQVSAADALTLARRSLGRPGLVLEWLHDADKNTAYQTRLDDFRRVLTGSLSDRFAFTETVATEERLSRRELESLLDDWMIVLRDGYLTRANLPERTSSRDTGGVSHDAQYWMKAASRLLETRRRLAGYANRRLALNTFFLSL